MRGGSAVAFIVALLAPGVLADSASVVGELPTARDGAAAVWTGKYVFLFGGGSPAAATGTLNEIVRYDPADGSAEVMGASLPAPLKLASAAWDGRYAYVFGGKVSESVYSADILRYDPATDSVVAMRGRLPTPRFGSGAVVVGDTIFVVGGRLATATDLQQVVRYDPAKDTVTALAASLPGGGYNAAVVTDGRAIYTFGGSRQNARTDLIARFDTVNDSASLLDVKLPHATMGIRGAWLNGRIHLFGGTTADSFAGTRDAYAFDPANLTLGALPVAPPIAIRDAPVVSDGVDLHIFGGIDGTQEVAAIQRFAPAKPPHAAFTLRIENLTLDVDASTSSDADGPISAYRWDWGDGSSAATGVTARHTYGASGEFNVTLTVTDGEAKTTLATASARMRAYDAPPLALFNVTLEGLLVRVDGTASADPEGALVSHRWDWGDGTPPSLGARTTHTYASAGNKTISLTVVDALGQEASAARRVQVIAPQGPDAARFSLSNDGLTVSVEPSRAAQPGWTWRWSWGDGTPDEEARSATHTYATAGAYNVRLTVIDERGGLSSDERQVIVDRPPIASFSWRADGGFVDFDATASSDPDGDELTYTWDFGDASPGGVASARTTHAYLKAGDYFVVLAVDDPFGARATYTGLVTVTAASSPTTPSPPPRAPDPSMRLVQQGASVRVSALAPAGGWTYVWDWGDGTEATPGADATHDYTAAGTFTVTLRALDATGRIALVTRPVDVDAPAIPSAPPATNDTQEGDLPGALVDPAEVGTKAAPGAGLAVVILGAAVAASQLARRR